MITTKEQLALRLETLRKGIGAFKLEQVLDLRDEFNLTLSISFSASFPTLILHERDGTFVGGLRYEANGFYYGVEPLAAPVPTGDPQKKSFQALVEAGDFSITDEMLCKYMKHDDLWCDVTELPQAVGARVSIYGHEGDSKRGHKIVTLERNKRGLLDTRIGDPFTHALAVSETCMVTRQRVLEICKKHAFTFDEVEGNGGNVLDQEGECIATLEYVWGPEKKYRVKRPAKKEWVFTAGVRYCAYCQSRRCVRQEGGVLPCVATTSASGPLSAPPDQRPTSLETEPIGIQAIDAACHGVEPGALWIQAGRPLRQKIGEGAFNPRGLGKPEEEFRTADHRSTDKELGVFLVDRDPAALRAEFDRALSALKDQWESPKGIERGPSLARFLEQLAKRSKTATSACSAAVYQMAELTGSDPRYLPLFEKFARNELENFLLQDQRAHLRTELHDTLKTVL